MSKFRFRRAQYLSIIGAMLAFPLGSCALMGSGEPPALYAFGGSSASLMSASDIAKPVTVAYAGSNFQRQSAGTEILTETGNAVAYVAGARWVAPASDLFDAFAVRKLEGASPSIRVIQVGDRPQADFLLSIEVRRFGAVYGNGPDVPPEAVVEARAKLVRISDRQIVGDWPLEHRQNAAENRVTAIVAALDQGADAILSQLADLTGKVSPVSAYGTD